jgi:hypothetical protein
MFMGRCEIGSVFFSLAGILGLRGRREERWRAMESDGEYKL